MNEYILEYYLKKYNSTRQAKIIILFVLFIIIAFLCGCSKNSYDTMPGLIQEEEQGYIKEQAKDASAYIKQEDNLPTIESESLESQDKALSTEKTSVDSALSGRSNRIADKESASETMQSTGDVPQSSEVSKETSSESSSASDGKKETPETGESLSIIETAIEPPTDSPIEVPRDAAEEETSENRVIQLPVLP